MSEPKDDEFFENMTPRVTGHILIRDPESGEVFVNQRDGNRTIPSHKDNDADNAIDYEKDK